MAENNWALSLIWSLCVILFVKLRATGPLNKHLAFYLPTLLQVQGGIVCIVLRGAHYGQDDAMAECHPHPFPRELCRSSCLGITFQ